MRADRPNTNATPSQQMMAELKFLRAQVESLKKAPVAAPTETAPKGPIVEHRVDVKTYEALRNLLVACENFFGGDRQNICPKEMKAAMQAAEPLVRKEKKP